MTELLLLILSLGFMLIGFWPMEETDRYFSKIQWQKEELSKKPSH